jgi:hypothetical protein
MHAIGWHCNFYSSLVSACKEKVVNIIVRHSQTSCCGLLQMYMMLQVWYTVTAAGVDASCIYLESFSFSLLCTVEYTHTVLPNFYIITRIVSRGLERGLSELSVHAYTDSYSSHRLFYHLPHARVLNGPEALGSSGPKITVQGGAPFSRPSPSRAEIAKPRVRYRWLASAAGVFHIQTRVLVTKSVLPEQMIQSHFKKYQLQHHLPAAGILTYGLISTPIPVFLLYFCRIRLGKTIRPCRSSGPGFHALALVVRDIPCPEIIEKSATRHSNRHSDRHS